MNFNLPLTTEREIELIVLGYSNTRVNKFLREEAVVSAEYWGNGNVEKVLVCTMRTPVPD